VVVVGRNAGKAGRLAAELKAPAFVADFADLAQVRELAAQSGPAPALPVRGAAGCQGRSAGLGGGCLGLWGGWVVVMRLSWGGRGGPGAGLACGARMPI
jgi:hypothetical protein